MKFDIVRAWKDETYRNKLSNKQRNRLPANPVGELNDTEMEMVYGGGGGGGGAGGGGMATPAAPVIHHSYHVYHHASTVVVATAAVGGSETRNHSYSVLCDINVFSADVHIIGVDRLLNIGSCETRPCFNND